MPIVEHLCRMVNINWTFILVIVIRAQTLKFEIQVCLWPFMVKQNRPSWKSHPHRKEFNQWPLVYHLCGKGSFLLMSHFVLICCTESISLHFGTCKHVVTFFLRSKQRNFLKMLVKIHYKSGTNMVMGSTVEDLIERSVKKFGLPQNKYKVHIYFRRTPIPRFLNFEF